MLQYKYYFKNIPIKYTLMALSAKNLASLYLSILGGGNSSTDLDVSSKNIKEKTML